MKRMIEKIKRALDEKTDPDKLHVTGQGVQMFFLRLLLMILIYAVVTSFVIKGVKIWQFLIVDGLIYCVEGFVKIMKRK